MRKVALLIPFVFAGCVTTETFNKTVIELKTKFKTENAVLRDKVRLLEETNVKLLARISIQTRLSEQLTGTAKFFFDETKALRGEWIMLGLRQAQVEKNFSDLKKKIKILKNKKSVK